MEQKLFSGLRLFFGVFILSFYCVTSIPFFGENCDIPEFWGGLRTTYNLSTVWSLGLNCFVDSSTSVPGRLNRTATIPQNTSCVNEIGSATYFGHRVNQHEDNSIVVLYDINGIVAGIQVRFRQDEVLVPNNTYRFNQIRIFQTETINGSQYFVITAYFVEPDIICKTGRTPDELNRLQGTGNLLYIQTGHNPSDHMTVPLNKEDATKANYSENECYPGIGHHGFPRAATWLENNCEWTTPLFLVYNDCGRLIGFGFYWMGNSTSESFEHPSAFGMSAIIGRDKAPQCLLDAANPKKGGVGLTSIHVWLVERNPACPLSGIFSQLSQAVSSYLGIN